MSQLRVALLQMAGCGTDQRTSLIKGESFCRQAKVLEADIALFPEMWNIGYASFVPEMGDASFDALDPAFEAPRQAWWAQAVGRESEFVAHYQKLAAKLDMAIAITYLEKWEPMPRNSVSLIDRHGQIVLTYAKVHTCDFSMEGALTPGDEFCVSTLDTRHGPVKIGAMICYDREFPESARVLMLKGAEIILTPNACDLEINRIAQFRTRAYENMAGMAMANYAAPQLNGHSLAFDGIAFNQNGSPRDMLVVEAGESEGIYMAGFDLEKLRDYRAREAWGNSFRKPRTYQPLVSPDVQPPFVRPASRR